MNHLAIDIGNTRTKFGVFIHGELLNCPEASIHDCEVTLNTILSEYRFDRIMIAATGNPEKIVTLLQKKGLSIEFLDHNTPLPFVNGYKTPQTLGLDRIALVAAAAKKFPAQAVLIIDAGTCVTYDFKSENEEYFGGSISPGLTMRFKALHTFTAKLPLLEPDTDFPLVGGSTHEAIQSGVINGIIAEIEGIIASYRADYGDFRIIFTGGDAQFLSKRLKNGIFAHSNFLLEGLDYIMDFNTAQ